jgi:hypothetical protein
MAAHAPQEILLIQQHVIRAFQQLYDRMGLEETRQFWSKIVDEKSGTEHAETIDPSHQNTSSSVENANSEYEHSPRENVGDSDDEDQTLCAKCNCTKCKKRKRKPDKYEKLDSWIETSIENAGKNVKADRTSLALLEGCVNS